MVKCSLCEYFSPAHGILIKKYEFNYNEYAFIFSGIISMTTIRT